MVTIFNRKELCITFSMKEQSDIRNVLNANDIEYYLKVDNRNIGKRVRTGSFGLNLDIAYEYTFYVNKKNYENAKFLIR